MTAVRVTDLDASVGFYVGQVGCCLVTRDAGEDVAVIEHAGYRLLLAGPQAGELAPLLQATHEIAARGSTIFFNGGAASEVEALRMRLEERGLRDVCVSLRWWGEHTISLDDPDGYKVVFWTTLEATPEELLALYAQGPDVLERALAGLHEEDLDVAAAPGEWTIRQIVHHVTDSEATVLARTKFGLAEPGRVYHPNRYLQDRWADGLDYAGRDIGPSVALFRAIREHITQLMQHLPDAWERGTQTPEGQVLTAGTMIGMLVSHAYEHTETIEEIRRGLKC
jgi:catechol 2,3-dioxygenase-like lactoylglutathione lyase family enzyme